MSIPRHSSPRVDGPPGKPGLGAEFDDAKFALRCLRTSSTVDPES